MTSGYFGFSMSGLCSVCFGLGGGPPVLVQMCVSWRILFVLPHRTLGLWAVLSSYCGMYVFCQGVV